MAKQATKTIKKKKIIEPVDDIRLSVHSTFNNTIITAAGFASGRVMGWTSSGQVGFKGAKKGTPYAATLAMKELLERIAPYQPKTAFVFVSGAGNGRDAALRALTNSGLRVAKIQDTTPLPHNGCRPKKARRV